VLTILDDKPLQKALASEAESFIVIGFHPKLHPPPSENNPPSSAPSSKPYEVAEPIPHHSGSPRLAVGIRDGRSRGDGFSDQDGMSRKTRPCVSTPYRASKLPTPNTTPTQRHAVPRAEHQRCIKTRHSFREARGIGSAALKGYNLRANEDLLDLHHVEQVASAVCGIHQQPALSCIPAPKQTLP
jgi:hypothetical protein